MTIARIIEAINEFAPLNLQEPWDNSGLQVGDPEQECCGVMLCVDPTPTIVGEAYEKGCNLIISHHPLLFKGLKRVSPGDNVVQTTVYEAIRNNIAVFSSHTSLDSAASGISRRMAKMLGALPLRPLVCADAADTGLGCIAEFNEIIDTHQFAARIKKAFGSPVVRMSCCERPIRKIGLCGGSGGEFIPKAIEEGCDAYLTSDVRYHDFVDHGNNILIADIGHFESEECSKQIFFDVISEKFPNFAVYLSEKERNPIRYI